MAAPDHPLEFNTTYYLKILPIYDYDVSTPTNIKKLLISIVRQG